MATQIEGGEPMSIGRVFSRGFGVIADNPLTVLGITFLFGTLPSVLFSWFQQTIAREEMDTFQQIGAVIISLGSFAVSIVLQALVQGALVRTALAYAQGERATLAESARAGLSVALPLIGLAILSGLGVGLGFILLIVPGIMLYVAWSVAAPALVAERIGVFEAFGRSRDLTRGARWKVFGLFAILVILYYIFISAFTGVLISSIGSNPTAFSGGLGIGWVITTAIFSTVSTMVWSTMQTSLYVELRNWKEGLPEQSLAEIFA